MYSISDNNLLFYGDNLTIMKSFPSECIDCIYLDPPFNSNRNYNLLYKNATGAPVPEQVDAFCDTWELDAEKIDMIKNLPSVLRSYKTDENIVIFWQMWMQALRRTQPKLLAYLIYMFYRFLEMQRILKKSGGIFLHCDPTASHYIKILMDSVFGYGNFRNEIIWKRRGEKHNLAKKHMGKTHDTILYYGNSPSHHYNVVYLPYREEYLQATYKNKDEKGFYSTFPATNEKGGNKEYEFMGIKRAWRFDKKKMQQLYDNNMLTQSKPTSPFRYKKYLETAKGVPIQDIWDDIPAIRGKDDIGYPTQKPLLLLQRIVEASCPLGGVVFDPFCGCGTSIYAAHLKQRKWIGCDIALISVKLVQAVLQKKYGLTDKENYILDGIPVSLEQAHLLFLKDPFQFQHWAVELAGGFCSAKKTADKGVDGRIYFETNDDLKSMVLSVKGGNLAPTDIRDLHGALGADGNAELAGFLSLKEPTAQMKQAAADAGTYQYKGEGYRKIQLVTVEEMLNGKSFHTPTKVRLLHQDQQYALALVK